MSHYRNQRSKRIRYGHIPTDPGEQRVLNCVCRKREMAGHPFDHAESKRVDVRPSVQRRTLSLFRRGVAGRSDDATTTKDLAAGCAGESLGQTKVGDSETGVLAEEEVGAFNVSMDNSLTMSMVESSAGLERYGQHLRRTERATRRENAPEAAASQILGHQKGLTIYTPVVDRDHVGIGQGGHETGLSPESTYKGLVAYQRRMKDLDCYPPP